MYMLLVKLIIHPLEQQLVASRLISPCNRIQ